MLPRLEHTAYLQALADDESEYQRDVLQARMYHDGIAISLSIVCG